MSDMACLRAVPSLPVLGRKVGAAREALPDSVSPSAPAASFGLAWNRTVLHHAPGRTGANERTAAVLADVDMAGSAKLRGRGVGDVCLTTSDAGPSRQDIGKLPIGEQFRMGSRECQVGLAVARDAKRLQILQAVGLTVISEQSERPNVITVSFPSVVPQCWQVSLSRRRAARR
jgi:hypothetical protein